MKDYSTVQMDGIYKARAISAEWKTTNNGLDFIQVEFKIEETGERVRWAGWMGNDPNKNKWTVASLRLMGCDSNDPQNLDGFDKNDVRIEVENVEKDGVVRSRVKWVKPVKDDSQQHSESKPANVSKYKDVWASVSSGQQKSNAARLPDAPAKVKHRFVKAEPAQETPEDDIPF